MAISAQGHRVMRIHPTMTNQPALATMCNFSVTSSSTPPHPTKAHSHSLSHILTLCVACEKGKKTIGIQALSAWTNKILTHHHTRTHLLHRYPQQRLHSAHHACSFSITLFVTFQVCNKTFCSLFLWFRFSFQ